MKTEIITDKLMGYAHAIIRKVADKLPNDYKLTDEEILSEIWVTRDELAKSYRSGPRSFESYFYEYAERKTVDRILRQYRRIERALQSEDEAERMMFDG